MAPNGRMSTNGLQGGSRAELDFGLLMARRGTISSTSLRARPVADKARIVAGVRREVWPLVEAGAVRPVIYAVFSLAEAEQAHRVMESNDHIGKILLLP